jgi:hypothetical protein
VKAQSLDWIARSRLRSPGASSVADQTVELRRGDLHPLSSARQIYTDELKDESRFGQDVRQDLVGDFLI